MPHPSSTKVARSPAEPRSTFIRDAKAVLQEKYHLQNRVNALETALVACVHELEQHWDGEEDNPEPECSVAAKKLLGWTL